MLVNCILIIMINKTTEIYLYCSFLLFQFSNRTVETKLGPNVNDEMCEIYFIYVMKMKDKAYYSKPLDKTTNLLKEMTIGCFNSTAQYQLLEMFD